MSGRPAGVLEGETIVWTGTPAQGLLLTRRDALLIPFSLIWAGFAVFWESSVILQPNAPVFFALWGIPFVLIGLYLVIGRFAFDAWLRSNTTYTVTDRRVLIDRRGPFAKFTALDLDRLPEISLIDGSGGRGSIRFGEQPTFGRGGIGFSGWTPSLEATPQFLSVPDVHSVFLAIQLASRHADRSISRR